MATYSQSYSFITIRSGEIIEDAYERCGKLPDELTAQKIKTAQRTLNFILKTLPNIKINLWTVQQGMVGLIENQWTYELPDTLIDILEANISTTTRELGGTAAASSGTAANAFDDDSSTACTQTSADGWISYSWADATYAISLVGVQSNVARDYTLEFQYSADTGTTWTTVSSATTQSFTKGQLSWFVIPVPQYGDAFRIQETGGATLNIQELYFSTVSTETPMSRISRADYVAIPQKSTTGKPANFYVDRQITPILNVYPAPTSTYTNMYYTYIAEIQDVGSMQDTLEIPSRFLEPITAGCAYYLAIKEQLSTDKVALLQSEYKSSLTLALTEDRERVTTSFQPDLSVYYL